MSGAFDRRSVLLGGAGLLTTSALVDCKRTDAPADAGAADDDDDGKAGKAKGAAMAQSDIVPTLVAVADRLLPSDDLGPGVKELGADLYFEKVLADPRMKAIKSIATRGAVWIHKAAMTEHKVGFAALDDAKKDDLVQRLVDKKVRPTGFTPEAFIRVMLALTLEAFLGDPRHGGNRDRLGWQWIGGIDWSGRK